MAPEAGSTQIHTFEVPEDPHPISLEQVPWIIVDLLNQGHVIRAQNSMETYWTPERSEVEDALCVKENATLLKQLSAGSQELARKRTVEEHHLSAFLGRRNDIGFPLGLVEAFSPRSRGSDVC